MLLPRVTFLVPIPSQSIHSPPQESTSRDCCTKVICFVAFGMRAWSRQVFKPILGENLTKMRMLHEVPFSHI